MEKIITDANFEDEVMKADKPFLVDFYADWCGPCKMMSPVVDKIAEKYAGKAKVGKVNVDEQQEIAGQFGIMSIPSFVFIREGRKVDQAMGAMPASALETKLDRIL
jgi:thioredoxin 1